MKKIMLCSLLFIVSIVAKDEEFFKKNSSSYNVQCLDKEIQKTIKKREELESIQMATEDALRINQKFQSYMQFLSESGNRVSDETLLAKLEEIEAFRNYFAATKGRMACVQRLSYLNVAKGGLDLFEDKSEEKALLWGLDNFHFETSYKNFLPGLNLTFHGDAAKQEVREFIKALYKLDKIEKIMPMYQ
jgi:hypothetical protein